MTVAGETPARNRFARLASRFDAGFWLPLALVAATLGGWLATHLDGFQWDNDEGMIANTARSVQLGAPLYTRIYSDHPPGLALLLAAVFNRFGASVEAGRLACLAMALFGAAGVAVLARRLVARAARSDTNIDAQAGFEGAGAWHGRRARFWPALAGLAAFPLLVLSPHFFWLGRALNMDFPQMALGVWALVALWVYRDGGRRRWLAVGAAFWAASQWFKLSGVLLVLPLALVVIQRHAYGFRTTARLRVDSPASWRNQVSDAIRAIHWLELGKDVLVAGAVVAVILSGWLLVAPAPAFVDNVIGSVAEAARLYPGRAAEYASWVFLENLFDQNLGLTLLALGGLVWLWWRGGATGTDTPESGGSSKEPTISGQASNDSSDEGRAFKSALVHGHSSRADALVLGLWWATTILGVIVQRPMWPKHHWSFLLWPMSVLAGVGFAGAVAAVVSAFKSVTVDRAKSRLSRDESTIAAGGSVTSARDKGSPFQRDWAAKVVPACLILVLIGWAFALPAQADALAKFVAPSRYNSARESVAWLEANTPADAVIVTDTGLIAFRANRRVPPELAVVSSKRNRTGRLTGAELIAITERDHAPAVVIWNALLTDFDDYKAYLRQHFNQVVEDEGRTIWQRKAP